MKKIRCFAQLIGVLYLLTNSALVQATSFPKFSIIPVLRAPQTIPSGGIAFAQYLITNNTAITRELTVVPLPGIFQIPGGASGCQNPFTLSTGQSCLLNLKIMAVHMTGDGIRSGPEICKTLSAGDNRPDIFLCSQPYPTDRLWVRVA